MINISELKFDKNGLIPAVVVDSITKDVLTVAYMNEEGVSVAVAAPEGGLVQSDVAVITDIVMTQSDYTMEDIRVVEVP